jgi:hypothetical protein
MTESVFDKVVELAHRAHEQLGGHVRHEQQLDTTLETISATIKADIMRTACDMCLSCNCRMDLYEAVCENVGCSPLLLPEEHCYILGKSIDRSAALEAFLDTPHASNEAQFGQGATSKTLGHTYSHIAEDHKLVSWICCLSSVVICDDLEAKNDLDNFRTVMRAWQLT